jgi:hypothetical protein
MANIITREVGVAAQGTPLSNVQIDNNFINLNTELSEKANTESPTFTGTVKAPKVEVTASSGDEGGEIFLNKPQTNTSISGGVTIDVYQNKLRFFETEGSSRGVFIDLTTAKNSVGSNILEQPPKQITVTTGTTNLNFIEADNFHLTLQANTTITISNADNKIGKSGIIVLKQDGVGGRTFVKPAQMKTPIGGATIDQWTTANSVSVISYYVVDADNLLINYIGNFA